jgi:S1-C subfamily serine protease
MKTIPIFLRCCLAIFLIDGSLSAAPNVMPDLTKDQNVDRKGTYNLGSTGLRGWIFLQPASHFDGLQGRTTAPSRQILVTHVGKNSPADGVVKVNDVILGVGGKPFTDDARKGIAVAIQEAEKEDS